MSDRPEATMLKRLHGRQDALRDKRDNDLDVLNKNMLHKINPHLYKRLQHTITEHYNPLIQRIEFKIEAIEEFAEMLADQS